MYRILIVEDDPTIAGVIERELAGWGYQVKQVADFARVMSDFEAFNPQLVLLDLSLPFRGGHYWCAEIRKTSKVPVVFISSSGDKMSLVTAIHQGGDDFIAKPFDLQVLVAKVQALLRRSYDFAAATDLLSHAGVLLNLSDASVHIKEQKVELTRNEFRILQLLMENKGRLVARETLMRRLWDDESFIDDNTLTVNITRLRKKLADAGASGFITTKKGLGYMVGADMQPQEE